MDDSELMKTFSSQNLQIRKFCCIFALGIKPTRDEKHAV